MSRHPVRSIVDLAANGARDVSRTTAWALSKTFEPANAVVGVVASAADRVGSLANKGTSAARQAASAVSSNGAADTAVEALLQRADEAAERADVAEADALACAREAKRAADQARRTAEDAEIQLAEAEAAGRRTIEACVSGAEAEGLERIRTVERDVRDHVERARDEAVQSSEALLANLRTRLEADVGSTEAHAHDAARRARDVLVVADEAVAEARDLATRARLAAEEVASVATSAADRLRWEDQIAAAPIGTPSNPDLSGRTKADLLQLARTSDVPGFLSMTKSELVEALSDEPVRPQGRTGDP
jgi:hypothetical protein